MQKGEPGTDGEVLILPRSAGAHYNVFQMGWSREAQCRGKFSVTFSDKCRAFCNQGSRLTNGEEGGKDPLRDLFQPVRLTSRFFYPDLDLCRKLPSGHTLANSPSGFLADTCPPGLPLEASTGLFLFFELDRFREMEGIATRSCNGH